MPLDPSIALGFRPPEPINPFAMAMQAQQFQAQRENMLGLREQRSLLAEQRRNALEDRNALDRAVVPGAGLDDILAKLPGHMHATITKQWGEANELADKAKKAKAEAALADADYFGSLAATLKSYNFDPGAAAIVLSHAKAQGHDTGQIEQLLQQDPSKLQQLAESLIAASPKQRELSATEALHSETGRHNLATEGAAVAGQAEAARHNLAGEQDSAQRLKYEGQRVGLESQRVKLEGARVNTEANSVPQLSPAGPDAAAEMFAKTGQLPPMGMGAKAAQTRAQIINRAADLHPRLDIASNKADFRANESSLQNVTRTLDTLTAFEGTAGKNLDQFLALAAKVPDTGVPWINSPIRKLNAKIAGSENQAAFEAARTVALREIARVTNDPKLSGVLSDSARKEVADLSPDNATFAQIKAVARTLKADMANVHGSLSAQRDAISGRISGAGAAPKAGTIRARDPQGNLHEAPVGTPLPPGWKLEGDG